MKPFIRQDSFLGLDAIRFGAGGYEALIVPGVGANIVELNHIEKGLRLMRDTTGLTGESFAARPQVYGIPVLFPPNRIAGGVFTFDGREYVFPITDKIHNNHLHGFLHKRPWDISRQEVTDDAAVIEAVFRCGPDTDFFTNFPHEFVFRYTITLSARGLECCYNVRNESDKKMPLGVGFHTAFNVPFDKNSDESDYVIKATVDRRWELTEAVLPSGSFLPPSGLEDEMRGDGVRAAGPALEAHHYSNKPVIKDGKPWNGAALIDKKTGTALVYEWGESFRHSVIWNLDGKSGFICPEPQTWMINAPNINLPDDTTGFRAIAPGEEWSDFTKIYVK